MIVYHVNIMTIRKVLKFFDRLENTTRLALSHHPILYAFIGGIGVVLFWRGIWHIADEINMGSIASFIIGSVILLLTGIFVSEFIGKKIIISDLVGDMELAQKEEAEIETEENQIKRLQSTLSRVEAKLTDLEKKVK